MLTIATWNVNGIRTLKGPLKHHLDVLNSDIICFQETKVASACTMFKPVLVKCGIAECRKLNAERTGAS